MKQTSWTLAYELGLNMQRVCWTIYFLPNLDLIKQYRKSKITFPNPCKMI